MSVQLREQLPEPVRESRPEQPQPSATEGGPTQEPNQPSARPLMAGRRAAIGKALVVWLATGSLGAAIVAFLIFKMMGC